MFSERGKTNTKEMVTEIRLIYISKNQRYPAEGGLLWRRDLCILGKTVIPVTIRVAKAVLTGWLISFDFSSLLCVFP